MSSYAEIEMKIVQWAEARRIVPNQKPPIAILKLVSEIGELADAEAKGRKEEVVDAVGDVMVCLINYCALKDINLVDCMYSAYNQIKDRKGTMSPEGVFVKEGDI
jgi:NTP pyrophosphatase (non-canonical NTP hydrolase)